MSIVSYLAYPAQGQRDQLMLDLQQHPHCEVILSDNSDVFILVTETANDDEEKQTQEFLKAHQGLLCLAMVYGQLETSADHPTSEPIDLMQRLEDMEQRA